MNSTWLHLGFGFTKNGKARNVVFWGHDTLFMMRGAFLQMPVKAVLGQVRLLVCGDVAISGCFNGGC